MTLESEPLTQPTVSPMMMQWHACKEAAKDAVLLFRMGDFYEAFHEDAVLIAKELELTLTKRQEIPMSGVPHHTSEAYIDKLVAKGYRVAVAEQLDDPKQVKGIVRREVVRIVTPGTLINSTLLSDKTNNYIAALTELGQTFGFAYLDLTTAEFRVVEVEKEQDLLNEIHRIRPKEMLVPKKFKLKHHALLEETHKNFGCLIHTQDDWHFDHQTAHDFLINHFRVHHLDGFGLKAMMAAINAAGALLSYLKHSLCLPIDHIQEVLPYTNGAFMSLDRITERHLELTVPLHKGDRKHTLLGVLDHTQTPMGARLLCHWIKQPLLSCEKIQARQQAVAAFLDNAAALSKIHSLLENVRDLQRLIMKVHSGYANPRDLVALKNSFLPLEEIKKLLKAPATSSPLLAAEEEILDPMPALTHLIEAAIVDDPPFKLNEGTIFRDGFHPELDELKNISRDSKSWIVHYQNRLREETNIKTLKVGFTKMFGYYIEVSKGQAENAPASFIRRQTLVNGERYITPELKEYESKALNAEERILAIENSLFLELRQEVAKFSPQVLRISFAIARIDCLLSFAIAALTHSYVCPKIDESSEISIQEGRHPVVQSASSEKRFVPNDTFLDDDLNRLFLITGPNMAGKSTYIRQVALIVIMAQIGSFVPAKAAHIGLVDRVFTRIGANDDLSRGQSTFMVEMTEAANILNNATSRSLVILDEIGRGTSTYDGISIAWSIAEYLLTTPEKLAKTLFATHYFELTKLEERIPGAVNYSVAVHENEEGIVFLHKIVRGGTDKSYGIHVGKLAGLPSSVISRAKEILLHLEENANRKNAFEPSKLKPAAPRKARTASSNNLQLFLFEPQKPTNI